MKSLRSIAFLSSSPGVERKRRPRGAPAARSFPHRPVVLRVRGRKRSALAILERAGGSLERPARQHGHRRLTRRDALLFGDRRRLERLGLDGGAGRNAAAREQVDDAPGSSGRGAGLRGDARNQCVELFGVHDEARRAEDAVRVPGKGRGTVWAIEHRYSRQTGESYDDGWGTLDQQAAEERLGPETTVIEERVKSILSKNVSPDLSFDLSINPYP